MKAIRLIAVFVAGAITAASCGTTFPFRYYAEHISERQITSLDVGKAVSDLCYGEGLLWGKQGNDGWPDLPLETCKPDPNGIKLKCMTTLVDDFYAIKGDNEKCHADLIACQHGQPPQ